MYMYIRIACYNISPKLLAGTVTRTIRGGLLSLIPMHSERDRNRERERETDRERERECTNTHTHNNTNTRILNRVSE